MKKVMIVAGATGFASLLGGSAQAEEINNEKVIEFKIENLTKDHLGYAQIEIGKGSDFTVTSAELVKVDGSKVSLEIKDGVVDTTVHGLSDGKYTIKYAYSTANFKQGAEIGSSILTGEEKPTTETKPAETKPVEETKPTETPKETKPVETTPTETKPAETPTETKPVETKPVETKPVETKPVETTPTETKPVETPTETKPVETKPVETKPVETKPVETTPTETKPVETPKETTPTETKPVETPKETKPTETKPTETPKETKPTETPKETSTEDKDEVIRYSKDYNYGKVIEETTPKFLGTAEKDILTESFVDAKTIKYEDDNTLEKGKEVVVVAGQDGLREKVSTWETEKGHRVGSPKVEERVIREKQDAVIKRGTKVVKTELEKQVEKNTNDIKELKEKVEPKVAVGTKEETKATETKSIDVPKVKDIEVPKLKTDVEKTEREKADEAFSKLPPEEKAKYIDDTYDIVEGAPSYPKVHKPVSPKVESAQLKLGTKEEIDKEADKVLDEAKTDEDVLTTVALKQLANADNKDLKVHYASNEGKLSSEKENKILENAKKVLPDSQVDDFKDYVKEQGKNPDNIDKKVFSDLYDQYIKTQNKQLENVVKSSDVGDLNVQVLRNSDEKVAHEVLEDVEKRVQKGELKGTNTAQLFSKEGVNGNVKVDGKSTSDKTNSNIAKASDDTTTPSTASTKAKQGKLSDTGLGDSSTAPFAMVSLALALMLAKRKLDLKKSEK